MNRMLYQDCIEACVECMNACNYSYVSNLKQYEIESLRECIQLDRECADICAFAVQAMTRHSPFVAEICKLCAKICEACAEECGKHVHTHCQDCVGACRRAAEACRTVYEAVTVYA